MSNEFLYKQLDVASNMSFLKKVIPANLAQNLNPKYELRPYQVDAFALFFHCYQKDFPGKLSGTWFVLL